MPHTNSAMKRVRQNQRRNATNRAARTQLHTVLKKARAAIAAAPKDAATEKVLRTAFGVLDRSARKGLIKKNEADRRKARLCLARDKAAAGSRQG
ncbi:MAG TPA: 30S ribosomal protein S20 [Planctomycetota bacterium]|nr:30S ribosomal protein S20 [Planctomycetota bacterium]